MSPSFGARVEDRARSARTVSDLSTLVCSDGDSVVMAGNSTIADGGGIRLAYRLTGRSSITVNGGTYFAGRLADDYYEAIDKKTVSIQQFGGYGNGIADDYAALNAAKNWAVGNKGRLFLYGRVKYNTKLVISGSQFEILMPDTFALAETGDCLIWGGADNETAVEINVIQRAKLVLSVVGTTSQVGVTAIKWKNPDGALTASNHNDLTFYMSTTDLGFHCGDFAGDGWHSNIDDNRFKKLDFYRIRNPMLVDSVATDNNVIEHFHAGGVPHIGTRIRDYIIRTLNCGNGFKILDGFARTDRLIANNAALDIKAGGLSTEKFSLEGDGTENDIRMIDLGGYLPRNITHVKGLYSPSDFRDSNGDVAKIDARGGVKLESCVFSGNVKCSRPVTFDSCLFTTGYAPVANGNNARITVIGGFGTRVDDGNDITQFESIFRGVGVASDPYDNAATTTFFVPVNRSSVFKKLNITAENSASVGAPTAYYAPRDEGREITMIFRSVNAINLLFNNAWILTNGTNEKAILANTTYHMTFLCNGGVWSETNSTPNDYSDLTNVPSLVSSGDFADAIGIDPAAWVDQVGYAFVQQVTPSAYIASPTVEQIRDILISFGMMEAS